VAAADGASGVGERARRLVTFPGQEKVVLRAVRFQIRNR
jgi:hypothetical protein